MCLTARKPVYAPTCHHPGVIPGGGSNKGSKVDGAVPEAERNSQTLGDDGGG